MRGSPSIGHSLPAGVSAQTTVKTLSGWSGEIRGEIAVSLFLAALPLRIRLSFEIRGFCEAQSDAHSELTPNFAAKAAGIIETCSQSTRCAPHSDLFHTSCFQMRRRYAKMVSGMLS
ncbi:hypothetical protein [Lapidilactobacillus salsurivasis]